MADAATRLQRRRLHRWGGGWRRCAESSACTCENCADELATCAAEYSCLQMLGTGTRSPDGDPFFTGFGGGAGRARAVTTCMQNAGCSPSCAAP